MESAWEVVKEGGKKKGEGKRARGGECSRHNSVRDGRKKKRGEKRKKKGGGGEGEFQVPLLYRFRGGGERKEKGEEGSRRTLLFPRGEKEGGGERGGSRTTL